MKLYYILHIWGLTVITSFSQATSFQVTNWTTFQHGLRCIDTFTVSDNGTNSITHQYNDFVGIRPDTLISDHLIQYQGQNTALWEDKTQYVSAGRNGLSVTTGASFQSTDPQQVWDFNVNSYDMNSIGDNTPDFFTVAIDSITSLDSWTLVDNNGNDLAILQLMDNDWNHVESRDATIVDTTTEPWSLSNANNQSLNGLAAELSDFVVISTGQNLSSNDATLMSQVSGMRVKISDGGPPETNYAFIASNTSSISFLQTVPEPSSSLLSILALSLLAGKRTRD